MLFRSGRGCERGLWDRVSKPLSARRPQVAQTLTFRRGSALVEAAPSTLPRTDASARVAVSAPSLTSLIRLSSCSSGLCNSTQDFAHSGGYVPLRHLRKWGSTFWTPHQRKWHPPRLRSSFPPSSDSLPRVSPSTGRPAPRAGGASDQLVVSAARVRAAKRFGARLTMGRYFEGSFSCEAEAVAAEVPMVTKREHKGKAQAAQHEK